MTDFETPRLRVRSLEATDVALYCHLYTDPAVMRHIGAPLSSEAALRNFHRACELATEPSPGLKLWVVAEHGAARGVGLLARVRHGAANDVAEMGIMLVAGAQGRGFAQEALGALTDQLFARPATRMLWTAQSPDNAAMVRLMHRLGFVQATERAAAELRWEMDRTGWLGRNCAQECDLGHEVKESAWPRAKSS
jgi:RimJ/RimL family protein N-acetyltransferase